MNVLQNSARFYLRVQTCGACDGDIATLFGARYRPVKVQTLDAVTHADSAPAQTIGEDQHNRIWPYWGLQISTHASI